MAKKSWIARQKLRQVTVEKHAEKRAALKAIIVDGNASDEAKLEASVKLQKMPRNSSATRLRNRCAVSGRPRGYMRKFGVSRIAFRDMALAGKIPGVRKASW
ncbi:MAG: 30S ribosomal protein S14 [Bacteroidetes Order II. Incertae sedis bacterium]|nr:30S ribosomal protein S14 [Bacteroidetes Order II. bacterium]